MVNYKLTIEFQVIKKELLDHEILMTIKNPMQ